MAAKRRVRLQRRMRATITIDPDRELLTVRPHRSRQTYTLPLADVAEQAWLRSRRHNEWERLPPAVRRQALGDRWLDGELIVPGRPATAVAAALAGSPDRDRLRFRPFHVPGLGLDPAAEHAWLIARGFDPPEYVGRFTGAAVLARWPEWSRWLVPRLGGEGLVLKVASPEPLWFKLKREQTVDLPVLDVLAGRGKFAGAPGALLCELPNGRTVRVSLTTLLETERRAVDHNDVGRIVEVAHLGSTARGSYRSPRFIRWRDDLPRHPTLFRAVA
jgi:hypothetical protein